MSDHPNTWDSVSRDQEGITNSLLFASYIEHGLLGSDWYFHKISFIFFSLLFSFSFWQCKMRESGLEVVSACGYNLRLWDVWRFALRLTTYVDTFSPYFFPLFPSLFFLSFFLLRSETFLRKGRERLSLVSYILWLYWEPRQLHFSAAPKY